MIYGFYLYNKKEIEEVDWNFLRTTFMPEKKEDRVPFFEFAEKMKKYEIDMECPKYVWTHIK
jgi:hypothetical protein